jgi:ABC-2 type transport system permease protein
MANRIVVALKGEVKTFWRNKSTIFWTVAFPVLLILLFGAIFSGGGTGKVDIHVQDLSDTPASQAFIASLADTGSVNVINVSKSTDIDQYIKDNSPYAVLIIPANFSEAFPGPGQSPTQLQLRTDPTNSGSSIAYSIVAGVASQYNLYFAGGTNWITVGMSDITQTGFSYIDFFIPGVIALTSMTTTIFWMVSVMTRYRTNGIFKKLTTTPITRYEWLTAQILWQLVVVFMSVAVIMLVGILVFDMHLTLTPLAILVIIMSSALFSSMGMIIARFIHDEETASTAANAITFPMMFLSGIFFNLAFMPEWLQAIAKVLPLYYVGEALRNTMVYDNQVAAVNNALVVLVLAVVFFVAGVLLSKWKDE